MINVVEYTTDAHNSLTVWLEAVVCVSFLRSVFSSVWSDCKIHAWKKKKTSIFYQHLLFPPQTSCCKMKLEDPVRNSHLLHPQNNGNHLPSTYPNYSVSRHKPHQQILSNCLTAGDFFVHISNEKQLMQRNLLMQQQVYSDSVNKATSSWMAGFFLLQGSQFTKQAKGKEKSRCLMVFSTKTSKPDNCIKTRGQKGGKDIILC